MRILILTIFLAAAQLARGDVVWSALILATNEQPARKTPDKLKDFAPTITRVFGYNSLYLLGNKSYELGTGTNAWIVPSKELFVQLNCLQQTPTFYQVRLELFQKETLLMESELRLARNAPLYIRGPQWGKGQLILVLEVR